MNLKKTHLLAAFLLVSTCLHAPHANAYKLKLNDETFVNFKAFVQTWMSMADTGSPDGDNWAASFYLRRMRLLFSGQVTDTVKFFYGTVHGNYGKNADFSKSLTTGDAWVELDFGKELKLDFGFLMIPFIHNFRQGGGSIHTIDWHLPIRKYPVHSHHLGRDTGLGLRGVLLDDHLSYFLHLTKGSWVEDGSPRITSRLVFNLFDAETDFHYAGTYLGKKKIVSFGLGLDVQPGNGGLNEDLEPATYYALGGDVFMDYPFGKNGLTIQINAAYYKNSIGHAKGQTCNFDDIANTCKSVNGLGVASEFGYRFGKFGPLIGFDWFRPDGGDESRDQFAQLLVGANYWIKGHMANIKLQYAWEKPMGKEWADGNHIILLQGHVLFN